MNTTKKPVETDDSKKWLMLVIATLSLFGLALNWFNVVPAIPDIVENFSVPESMIGFLVSAFVFGYGIIHIPAGFLVTKFGVRNVLVGGLILESLAVIASIFLGESYWMFLFWRFIAGLGGGAVVSTGLNLGVAWFPEHQKRLALGIIAGLGITGGAGVGTYLWGIIIENAGWQSGLIWGGVIGLFIALLTFILTESPPGVDLGAHRLTRDTIRSTLWSRDLWALGIAVLGTNGLWITATQLSPSFSVEQWGFTTESSNLLAGLVLWIGIPGTILGGVVADRSKKFIRVISWPTALLVLAALFMPISITMTWVAALLIGFFFQFLFTPVTAAPYEYKYIPFKGYAIGVGFLIAFGDIGGVVFPIIYSQIASMYSGSVAWIVLSIVTAICGMGLFIAREPRKLIMDSSDNQGSNIQ